MSIKPMMKDNDNSCFVDSDDNLVEIDTNPLARPGATVVTGMRFRDLIAWLEGERVRLKREMIDAAIRFSGRCDGRIEQLDLEPASFKHALNNMPFELSDLTSGAEMLCAYDYCVAHHGFRTDVVLTIVSTGFVSLDAPEKRHRKIPDSAYHDIVGYPL